MQSISDTDIKDCKRYRTVNKSKTLFIVLQLINLIKKVTCLISNFWFLQQLVSLLKSHAVWVGRIWWAISILTKTCILSPNQRGIGMTGIPKKNVISNIKSWFYLHSKQMWNNLSTQKENVKWCVFLWKKYILVSIALIYHLNHSKSSTTINIGSIMENLVHWGKLHLMWGYMALLNLNLFMSVVMLSYHIVMDQFLDHIDPNQSPAESIIYSLNMQ